MRHLIVSRHRYRYTLFAVVFAFLALIVSVSVQDVRASEKTRQSGERLLTVYDRGTERVFLTSAGTVGEALERASIELEPTDTVEPSVDEELIASNYNVNIYRARPVVVVDGASRHKVMTSRQTPEQIAKSAGIELHQEDATKLGMAMDVLGQGASVELVISRATPLTLVLYGKPAEIRTQATTVEELLEEKDIQLGPNDELSAGLNEPIEAGMKLELWREGKQTVTEEEAVDFEVEQIRDADREVGYRNVRTPGEKGKRTVTYEVVIKNGREVSRKEIASVTTKHAKKQVEVVGVKFNYTGGPLNEEQITFLGTCESGMNPTSVSRPYNARGDRFYGAFQFMPGTWRSVHSGPYALPHEAPLEVQKQAVQDLLSGSNIYNQFPSCARQMQARGLL